MHILSRTGQASAATTHMAGGTAPDLLAYNASIIVRVWSVQEAAWGYAVGTTGALVVALAQSARCPARMLASHMRHCWQWESVKRGCVVLPPKAAARMPGN